jgi:hypothetical protein
MQSPSKNLQSTINHNYQHLFGIFVQIFDPVGLSEA